MYKSEEVIQTIGEDIFKSKDINTIYELQNKEYEGFRFELCSHTYRSRLAKLTPKKKGYFVAFWEKVDGANVAFSKSDSPDTLIVHIIDKENSGQFVFPKEVLVEKGILRSDTCLGKMGMRVYPNWEINLNPSARKTQEWQVKYFINDSAESRMIDIEMMYMK